MNRSKPIYVEIFIAGDMETLWRRTQSPELHQRWDLRFTDIHYLPRPDPAKPQEFLYATRIGLGLRIEGRGESVGERVAATGERSSSLKFWSDDRKSLIQEGSGYWQYIPQEGGVKFLTLYDYRVRFGTPGMLFNRLFFRPLMGWATAWSFDRLRLWIENGTPPEVTFRLSAAHFIARLTVAFVWLWHGLVPKLLVRHPDEARPLLDAGLAATTAERLVLAAGWLEILLGLGTLIFWRSRWTMIATVVLMTFATAGVLIFSPQFLRQPFNPLTLNLLLCSAAAIALLTQSSLASATRCVRTKRRD